jgi:hypothetical protein
MTYLDFKNAPLVIEFASGTSLHREHNLVSQLPVLRNGPAGTFVVLPHDLRVSLPTDQIVHADDSTGCARAGFGGMHFVGLSEGSLIFVRVRELQPEERLSPDRSHTMMLNPDWISSVHEEGRQVWP